MAIQGVKAYFRPYLHVFPPIWVLGPRGVWGAHEGLVENLLIHLSTLGSPKIEVFETFFYDTVNHLKCFVKHVLGRIYMFFTLFGYWAH